MKFLLGLRVVATLFVAVLLPLELSHCALMPLQAAAIASTADHARHEGQQQAQHHDDGDHDCCRKSDHAATPQANSPADPCCCVSAPLPVATTPALVSLAAPTSVHAALAIVQTVAISVGPRAAFARLEPDARSGSPPDPSTAPQSPRSPPCSASLPVLILT